MITLTISGLNVPNSGNYNPKLWVFLKLVTLFDLIMGYHEQLGSISLVFVNDGDVELSSLKNTFCLDFETYIILICSFLITFHGL